MSTPGHEPIIPSEARLVLLTACGEWADRAMAGILADPIDWRTVQAFATAEQACAATANRLARVGVPSAGRDTLAALQRQGAVEEFRMELLEERLEKLMARFRGAGVDFVLLKGAAIALGYYGTLKSRPMGDIDILVRAERASAATTLARELDWVPRKGLRDELYLGMPHLPPLVAADGLGFGLEIHTDLFPDHGPFRFGSEDVWRHARPLARAGGPRVPRPEDLLLHSCLHFAWSHGFRRGAWRVVRDLDALLSDSGLHGDEFTRLATYARGETCVYWTFVLVGALTGRVTALLPPDGPQIVGGPAHRAILRHLIFQSVYAPDVPGTRRLGRVMWSLAVRPRASGHGSARPWSAEQRWELATIAGGRSTGGLASRARGFFGYVGRLTGVGSSARPSAS
jgi:hypothetical protein